MKNLYHYIFIFAISLILGCKSEKESDSVEPYMIEESSRITLTTQQYESSEMISGEIEKRSFDKIIQVNGQIKLPHKSKAIVSSFIKGTVGDIDIIEGQWVSKGKTLFTVTNPELIDLQEQFLVLQSKTAYLREEQARKEQLVSEKLSPRQELLKSKADYQTNQAQIQALDQKLGIYGLDTEHLGLDNLKTTVSIQSPISGYIAHINTLRGQYIDPLTEVVTIENNSEIFLELAVLEKDALLINKGQEIKYSVAGSPDKAYKAEVYLKNSAIDNNGMVNIHCRINRSKELMPGMYATAEIIIASYEGYGVPEEALVQVDKKNNVLIENSIDGNQLYYETIAVETGMKKDGYIEIRNNKELMNKKILVKGGYYLVN